MEEMEAYTGFAEVYDTFMDDTPYEEGADSLAGLIGKYGISRPVQSAGEAGCAAGTAESTGTEQGSGADPSLREALEEEKNLVLDLGCGTGTLTELLSQKGFDMIGVDSSEEMLQLAMDKKEKTGSRILYLCQKYQLPVILSSDSHGKEHVGDFTYAEEFVHQLMFPETLILNNQLPKLKVFLQTR